MIYDEFVDALKTAGWKDTGDAQHTGAWLLWRRIFPGAPIPPQAAEELSPDFTDTARAALLWVLWHHQGGSSPVGQPIRFALGMGQFDHLSDHQLREAKRWGALPPQAVESAAPQAAEDAWISVNDRLPTLKAEYVHNLLVCNAIYGSREVAMYDGYAKYFDMGSTSRLGGHDVTHWQPLPKPPAAMQPQGLGDTTAAQEGGGK